MVTLPQAHVWCVAATVSIACVTDWRKRRIPNWLTFPSAALALAVSYFFGQPGIGAALLGCALGFGVSLVFRLLGGMGMGDVKLLTAAGAWLGFHQMGSALVLTGLAGGVMALAWALRSRFVGELLTDTGTLMAGFVRNGLRPNPNVRLSSPNARALPFAPAIAAGVLCSYLAG